MAENGLRRTLRKAQQRILDAWTADANRYRDCAELMLSAARLAEGGAIGAALSELRKAEALEYQLTGDCVATGAIAKELQQRELAVECWVCGHLHLPGETCACRKGGTTYLVLDPRRGRA